MKTKETPSRVGEKLESGEGGKKISLTEHSPKVVIIKWKGHDTTVYLTRTHCPQKLSDYARRRQVRNQQTLKTSQMQRVE